MEKLTLFATLFCFLLLTCQGLSQDKKQETKSAQVGTKLNPPATYSGNLLFGNVALAKAAPDGKAIRMIIPQVGQRTKSQQVTVSKCRIETRTRTIELPDGNKREENYSVSVPYTETLELTSNEYVVVKKLRLKVPVGEIVCWRLNGTKVDADELPEKTTNATHFWAHRSMLPFKGVPSLSRPVTQSRFIGDIHPTALHQ